jgi:CRISPR/Cas system type I-B associated protein Csh2 (Cas7 group RAMP superfamily)
MQAVRNRIDEAKDSLVVSTNEREYDLFIKGMIQAFTEVLTMKFSDEQEDKNEIQY